MGRFIEIFGTPLPSDPAEVKVAADFREAMVLWDVSQEKRALVPPVTSIATLSPPAAAAKQCLPRGQ